MFSIHLQESEIPSEEGYCDFNSRPNENSYCYQLLRQLNEQRKKGILCDVSIVVSGKIFKAHKNILVAGSRPGHDLGVMKRGTVGLRRSLHMPAQETRHG